MQHGEILVFKMFADWSMKRLFRMFLDTEETHMVGMNKVRDRLKSKNQNVGVIYVVEQANFGLLFQMFYDGIGENGWYDNKGKEPKHLNFDELEYVIRITNRYKPTKASWFKVRK